MYFAKNATKNSFINTAMIKTKESINGNQVLGIILYTHVLIVMNVNLPIVMNVGNKKVVTPLADRKEEGRKSSHC